MDMTMCDVTDIPCEVGDNVTLIGADADSGVAAIAAHAGRSPYEVLAGLNARARRIHLAGRALSDIGAAA